MRGGTLKEHIKEKMRHPQFKKAWQELDTEFYPLEGIIKARKKAGLTQAELAGPNTPPFPDLKGEDLQKRTLRH
jgi:hypothetical protein